MFDYLKRNKTRNVFLTQKQMSPPVHLASSLTITLLKLTNLIQKLIMIAIIRNGTFQSYKVSSKSDQGFWRNSADKILNANISKSHNSAKNHQFRMGLVQCTNRHCTNLFYKDSLKCDPSVLKKPHRNFFQRKYFKSHNSCQKPSN